MRMLVIYIFLALFVLYLPGNGLCIDKGYFQDISEEDFNSILEALQAVKIYYPVCNGKAITTEIKEAYPMTIAPIKYALFIYFNPQGVGEFFKTVTDLNIDLSKCQFMQGNAVKAFRDMYTKPLASSRSDSPDIILLEDQLPRAMVIQHLAYKDSLEPYTIRSKEDKTLIPAFISGSQAMIKMDEDLIKNGLGDKLTWVGIGVKEFFDFIIENKKKGRYVIVAGYEMTEYKEMEKK